MPFERLTEEERDQLEKNFQDKWVKSPNLVDGGDPARVLELLRDYKIMKEAYESSSDRYVRLRVYLLDTFNVDIHKYDDMTNVQAFGEDLMKGVFKVMKKRLFGSSGLL